MKTHRVSRQTPRLLLCAAALSLTAATPTRAEPLALGIAPAPNSASVALPFTAPLAFPGETSFELRTPQPADWLTGETLRVTLVWPSNAPAAHALAWLKDRDDYWHQYLLPVTLRPGETNVLAIPFQAGAAGWQTPGHTLAWHYRIRLHPQSVGFRLFGDTAFTGTCAITAAVLDPRTDTAPPTLTGVRTLTREPQAFARYEARFDLPDRYANPFDPTQIDAGARITAPDGSVATIHAFYYQPCYRIEDEFRQPVEPDGPPEWRVRYCPRLPGDYTVTLYARDARGATESTNVLRFTAAPAASDALRFVRVSRKDPRYFEFDDGSLFYPIGHNVRSATDERMDDKFPWVFRREQGTTAYRHYFQKMQEAGENFGEVWMSAWSLGLEWTEGIGGYHGANDYHLGNAWELDRVLDLARQHRIHLNLVLNYHGRVSTWLDAEWHLHPYNQATPGGWLDNPLAFFSDAKAIDLQKRFCRYTQARWGWSPVLLGYELCSELNLAGPSYGEEDREFRMKTHFKPEVVAWCRVLGDYFKSIDPYGHLVSAHISNDYNLLNPVLCKLPEMDFIPLDAYNNGNPERPERIIDLVLGTANAGAAYDKPTLITEFGGSAMSASLENLKTEHHAALWSGACLPLAGLPMFWWWQVLDENDLYSRYTAVARFLEGVDPRNPAERRVPVALAGQPEGDGDERTFFEALATAAPDRVRGYVYPNRFPRHGRGAPQAKALTVTLEDMTPGIFRVEAFETETGRVTRRFDVRTQEKRLSIPLPPFTTDCAFKARLITP